MIPRSPVVIKSTNVPLIVVFCGDMCGLSRRQIWRRTLVVVKVEKDKVRVN
jgi:hypothetical protein